MSSADGKAGGCPGEGTDRPSPACGSASRGRGHCAPLCAGRPELCGASAVQVPGGQEPLRIRVQSPAGEPSAQPTCILLVLVSHITALKLLLASPCQQDRGEVLEASLCGVLTAQDAVEYFQYLLEIISRTEHSAAARLGGADVPPTAAAFTFLASSSLSCSSAKLHSIGKSIIMLLRGCLPPKGLHWQLKSCSHGHAGCHLA